MIDGFHRRRLSIISWLSTGLREEQSLERIFAQLCARFVECGVNLSRSTLHLRVHHPQWLGTRILWARGQSETEVQTVAYDVEGTDVFRRSPFRLVIDTGRVVRQRILICGPHVFPVYEELRNNGHTDYIAWPLDHTQGRRHLITFATDKIGGFDDQEIMLIEETLPLVSLVTEIRLKNQLARTLLQTYVGPHASEQILDGATTRGSGVTLRAAVMMCDLRNFTRLSDRRRRDDVIKILNQYFDLIADPIEKYGGEILKFVGDGLLAVFPLDRSDACTRLLKAVREAQEAAAAQDQARDFRIEFGTGIHVGEVMYGNIGSKRRLDFTVIGPAVNLASRLESLTKSLQRSVLISGEFVTAAGCLSETECLGRHNIRGFEAETEVYALRMA